MYEEREREKNRSIMGDRRRLKNMRQGGGWAPFLPLQNDCRVVVGIHELDPDFGSFLR